MIVVDASAIVCLLAERPAESVGRLTHRLLREDLHAPHLIDVEVTHTLRRLALIGEAPVARAEAALTDLAALRLVRHLHTPLLREMWRMRENRTAYDAAYVALAEFLRAPLITLDERLARTPAAVPIEVF